MNTDLSAQKKPDVPLVLITIVLFIVLAAVLFSTWLTLKSTSFNQQFTTLAPPCTESNWPQPHSINHTAQVGQSSSMIPSSQIPFLSYESDLAVTIANKSPIAITTGPSGSIYGLFMNDSKYYLAKTNDFFHWSLISKAVVPHGYEVTPGGDISVTSEGVILISATRLADHQNSTIFVASFNGGITFQTVLNASLLAKPENYTGIDTGPGSGFWHGIIETSNSYLFAGLYNPQGLVYRSENGGRAWNLILNASQGSDWHNEIHDLAVNPYNNFLYVTTDDESGTNTNHSLLISTDYGSHWVTIYNSLQGGAGLPLQLTPTTIGFLDNGSEVALGLEGFWKSQFSHSIFLLKSNPHGCLAAEYWVAASSLSVDPFISWWMSPKNYSSVFVLTHENDPFPKLGVGLFVLSDKGGVSQIMSLSGQNVSNWYSISFLQISGPSSMNSYGVLFNDNSHQYLAVVKL
ncbi:MAG: hypothetical protein JRN15_13215 [Nitrososphaerota archaeon]|nr:hypothetical protein [Nitrososphaerota archaeon]